MKDPNNPINISPNLPEGLRRSMQKFQAVNDIPIHLKGGPFDRILVSTTFALCGLGIIGVASFVYSMARKKD